MCFITSSIPACLKQSKQSESSGVNKVIKNIDNNNNNDNSNNIGWRTQITPNIVIIDEDSNVDSNNNNDNDNNDNEQQWQSSITKIQQGSRMVTMKKLSLQIPNLNYDIIDDYSDTDDDDDDDDDDYEDDDDDDEDVNDDDDDEDSDYTDNDCSVVSVDGNSSQFHTINGCNKKKNNVRQQQQQQIKLNNNYFCQNMSNIKCKRKSFDIKNLWFYLRHNNHNNQINSNDNNNNNNNLFNRITSSSSSSMLQVVTQQQHQQQQSKQQQKSLSLSLSTIRPNFVKFFNRNHTKNINENQQQQQQFRNSSIPETVFLGSQRSLSFALNNQQQIKQSRYSVPTIIQKDKAQKSWERMMKMKNDEKRNKRKTTRLLSSVQQQKTALINNYNQNKIKTNVVVIIDESSPTKIPCNDSFESIPICSDSIQSKHQPTEPTNQTIKNKWMSLFK
ncbi:hypothetical protein DERP_005849 [Dermatophagoides pteronyssinus]|uniref:Uncharacterized protein n=1 Tax=Dermatophagoides pteronyssinus TaxID=6956 RepID=A0ABQ8J9Q5_DERPT|nr:hypothetical protein DERP_005849 [Dermatophagoides pteronyssinus]